LLKRKKKNPTEQDLRITSLLPLLIAFLLPQVLLLLVWLLSWALQRAF
jgi:hypothetical protein